MANSPSAIQTYSGRWVDVFNPDPATIEIDDIAHALSILPRFGGHGRYHFSVAAHSLMVARLCPPAHRLWGLLHDASEAYLIDLPRPIKRHARFAAYHEVEANLMGVILDRFGLPRTPPPCVKAADNLALFAEAEALFDRGYQAWPACWAVPAPAEDITRLSHEVFRHAPEEAEASFLNSFAIYRSGGAMAQHPLDATLDDLRECRRYCRRNPAEARRLAEKAQDAIGRHRVTCCGSFLVDGGGDATTFEQALEILVRIQGNLSAGIRVLVAAPDVLRGYCDGATIELQDYIRRSTA